MVDFSKLLNGNSEYETILENYLDCKTPIHITGVSGSQKSHLIYSISKRLNKKCIVITTDEVEAGRIKDDLSFLFGREISLFKNKEYVFYNVDASNHAGEISRIKSIYDFINGDGLVTSIESALKYTISPEKFKENTKTYKVSDVIDIDEFISSLLNMGYVHSYSVENVGQFTKRGSIIDVFSPSLDNPVRIDLFDDEIDSLRLFDVQSQVSVENINEFTIIPVREIIYTKEKATEISQILLKSKNENLYEDANRFKSYLSLSSFDKYSPYFYDRVYSVVDFACNDTLVFIDESKQVYEISKTVYKEQNEIITDLLDKNLMPKVKKPYLLDYSNIINHIDETNLFSLGSLSGQSVYITPKSLCPISSKTLHSYSGKTQFLYDDIRFWKKNGYKIIITLSSEQKLSNLYDELLNENINSSIFKSGELNVQNGEVMLVYGFFHKGFEYPLSKIAVISDSQMSQSKKTRRVAKKSSSYDVIKSFEDLSKGDYVVHRTHGIGRYAGIKSLTIDNVTKDYLKIKYKGSDILYVPTNQLDLLSKYTDSDSQKVKLNSLGGNIWANTLKKVKSSVDTLAEDLIELYSQRSTLKGHKFSPDTSWQKEFEEKFIYDETPDQLKSIEEVKSDMESDKCMDRLLCGDVGYGKTEVALRAAFKCVMDGKQVAYLVPTTILAQQHFNTFSSRLGEYAMKVEMLSRFRTKRQIEKSIEGLRQGSVDVVVGTHRLLQKDVSFKNLGLLIVDEEQRFGVSHKEKIKELKKDVDVLTLSATPIPRTLNMAMVGIRDLSILSEPPSDRYPVQTFVLEYNDQLIINAIKRELERKGQVYYLYNRVDSIDKCAIKLQNMLPDARIKVAHGQMSETELENIMISLIEGEIDVLVCTTIIETGLDVSNVNTIIIENADCLGLSQLYQLRGRVGRSNRLSYAYLTYYPGKILDQVAHKRLQTIKEFTEFGSGFKIAMRDLEIRGAGNLLGKKQHGNINLIGYEMYCMLLQQAVKEKKGEEYIPPLEVSVDIKVDAYIPDNYVEYEHQRIDLYKKIAQISSYDDYLEMQAEFIDRFGDVPKSVSNLIDISYIKTMCEKCKITELSQNNERIVFTFTNEADVDAVVKLLNEYNREMRFINGEKAQIVYMCKGNVIENIKIILQKLLKSIQKDD